MRKSLAEETVLFISIIKWVVLSTVVGAMVGGATGGFLKLLAWSTDQARAHPYSLFLLPAALFLSALIVKYLAPDAEGHGTEKVIEAVHQRSGKIKAAVVPVKLVATIITLALGGSAGKEGPCAQIGAGLSSILADLIKFDDQDRKKLVICGISAGFAAVFGTPIAGSIFGVEVLFVGALLYDVLLPSFIAGITAYQVARLLGVSYFHHPISFVPMFSEMFLAKVILAGIFFGVVSVIFIQVLKLGEILSHRLKIWPPLKGLIGGTALIWLGLTFSDRYLGLGLNTIEGCLQGDGISWYGWLVKSACTSITLNFGGSGGIVTPIFFVGATSGSVFAKVLGLHLATFAAIGMVSLLAGAANTPIAASVMAVEIFGPEIAPYAAVACVVSFLMTGHRSVYPSQYLSVKKSSSLQVELGHVIEETKADVQFRGRSLIGLSLALRNWVINLFKKKLKPKDHE